MLEPEAQAGTTRGGLVRKPAKTAALLVGLGVGAAAGPSLGPAAAWSGIAIAALGVALFLLGTRESDLVGDGGIDDEEEAEMPDDGAATAVERRPRIRQRSTFAHLGPHVEQILRLAEEQASTIVKDARRESERLVAAARREADAHLNLAREQTAGLAGAHQDLSSIPPTQTPPSGEDPGRRH
ncbi:hypothetical protein AB0C42_18145 [Micromonospora taraxaci]|uniref:hypothetical protein n=1 Tax=Micromonospora taraxaci TaxID=1316803 RepID=UPI0033E0D1B7